jgi:hypothetical protein
MSTKDFLIIDLAMQPYYHLSHQHQLEILEAAEDDRLARRLRPSHRVRHLLRAMLIRAGRDVAKKEKRPSSSCMVEQSL